MAAETPRPRVVIVGGGFGGLACARKLAGAPVDVTLVDSRDYHLFTPLLYQVATGLLHPADIAYPFRAILRRAANVRFHQATVAGIDFEQKTVRTGNGHELPTTTSCSRRGAPATTSATRSSSSSRSA